MMIKRIVIAFVFVATTQIIGYSPKILEDVYVERVMEKQFRNPAHFHRWIGKMAFCVIIFLSSCLFVYFEEWKNVIPMFLYVFHLVGSAANIPFLLFADLHLNDIGLYIVIFLTSLPLTWVVIMTKKLNINRLERVAG